MSQANSDSSNNRPSTEAGDATLDQAVADAAEAALAGEGSANEEAEVLRRELEEVRDRVLRTQAELENYRKRVRREMEEERRFANLPLLADLLPVVDNLGRAMQAAEKSTDAAGLLEGVRLVAQQLESVFARHHCRRIESLARPFDPHLHQAILQQPSAEQPPGMVLQVAQEGYQLHERVLRPAQVIVSTAAAAGEAAAPGE